MLTESLRDPFDQIEVRSAPPLGLPRFQRPRRTLADRVGAALLSITGGKGTVLSHEEKAWASITFAGTRHEVVMEFCGPDAVAAAGCGDALFVDGAPDVISILQISPPIGSVVFSCATMRRIPVASAGSSKVALSDSTSAMISSVVTCSPSFLSQVEIVTSVMDSPTAGTFISFTPPVA